MAMLPSFEKCVGAMADTLVWQEQPSFGQAAQAEKIATFLLESHARMPDHLRVAFRILTFVFDSWPYPLTGRPFHALSLSHRTAQVGQWTNSRFQFRHALITFFRTLTVFGLYAETYKQDYDFGSQPAQD
jgi:hypothetical protein